MLRKTLGTVRAISALCVGSAAMAAHMGGGGGGWGGGGGMMHGGRAPMINGGGSMGPTMRAGPMTGAPMTAAPMTRSPTTTGPVMGGRVQGWNGRTAWGGRFHDHFHNRHNRFFAFVPAGRRCRPTMASSGLMFAATTPVGATEKPRLRSPPKHIDTPAITSPVASHNRVTWQPSLSGCWPGPSIAAVHESAVRT